MVYSSSFYRLNTIFKGKTINIATTQPIKMYPQPKDTGVEYEFTQIFDIPHLTKTCEAFTKYSGAVTALLDLDGKVHIATGWQDICTKFHRVNPETACRCTESDTALASQLGKGECYNVYECKNGLVDVAIPVIVNGEHVGNFFTGQFFFETPKINQFVKQAEQFGFDKEKYLDALGRVPIFSKAEVKKIMGFLIELTQLIGELGVDKLKLLESERKSNEELKNLVEMRTLELNNAKSNLENANKKLLKLSYTDQLTRIPNRRAYEDRLEHEINSAKRNSKELSFLLVDIDNFKEYNDTYGHENGDIVLMRVAKILNRALVRKTDFVARYGGEELVVLLPSTDTEGAEMVAKTIIQNITSEKIPHSKSPYNHITVSIGMASTNKMYDDLLNHADKALYKAKGNGRNRYEVYHS